MCYIGPHVPRQAVQDLIALSLTAQADARYAIDPSRIRNELGWRPSVTIDEGLEKLFAGIWIMKIGGGPCWIDLEQVNAWRKHDFGLWQDRTGCE